MPEISKEEARKRLEDAVKKVDWITYFLGDASHQNDFLEVYRGLHAQLHEGDRLEIVVNQYDSGKFIEVPSANFQIVLHTKDGKKEDVYDMGVSGGTCSRPLLYKN